MQEIRKLLTCLAWKIHYHSPERENIKFLLGELGISFVQINGERRSLYSIAAKTVKT